jgi:GAF domain-containing protein
LSDEGRERDERRASAALSVLAAVARRAGTAERLESAAGEAVLRSVVDAAVALIRAEAASIALHDPATDRLVFRVAAGEHGRGVVGVTIGSGEGVAGYVFSTGQPLAIGEAASDPRSEGGRGLTGYLPRCCWPSHSRRCRHDRRLEDRPTRWRTFDLRDMEAASIFARQATVAIRTTRLERDTAHLLEWPPLPGRRSRCGRHRRTGHGRRGRPVGWR